MHLAASDKVHCPLHVHTTPVVEDIADAASTVDKAHVTLLTTGSKAEAAETDGKGGEWMEYSGERRVVRRAKWRTLHKPGLRLLQCGDSAHQGFTVHCCGYTHTYVIEGSNSLLIEPRTYKNEK